MPVAEPVRRHIADAAASVPGLRVAYLFGSRASGRSWAESDLDIAVRWDRALDDSGRKAATLALIQALTARLGKLGERADIADIDRVGSAVAFRAVRDGVRVFEGSRRESVQLVVDVMRRYDDDAPRRALFRRAARRAVERLPGEHRGRP